MTNFHSKQSITLNQKSFWEKADKLQEQTLQKAQALFIHLQDTEPTELSLLLLQYRFFTSYYIEDLAIIIARMKNGPFRSFLAELLMDELGQGKYQNTHTELYDSFLTSLGCLDNHFDNLALKNNIELLDQIQSQLLSDAYSDAYCIGLRGMGGECICQVYLDQLYQNFIKNPFIQESKEQINWQFWTLHIGEHDIHHREQTRLLVSKEIERQDKTWLDELYAGFQASMSVWEKFWDNIFTQKAPVDSAHVRLPSRLSFKHSSAGYQFHLAIPTLDMSKARAFYTDILGATEGRSTPHHIDFNLYEHHFVIHQAPPDHGHLFASFITDFYDETVRIPHFGINMSIEKWQDLADRVNASGWEYLDPPHTRQEGEVGEHRTFFILDPSGYALEFKAFTHHDEVFAKIFQQVPA